jgi:hypothetical protein
VKLSPREKPLLTEAKLRIVAHHFNKYCMVYFVIILILKHDNPKILEKLIFKDVTNNYINSFGVTREWNYFKKTSFVMCFLPQRYSS